MTKYSAFSPWITNSDMADLEMPDLEMAESEWESEQKELVDFYIENSHLFKSKLVKCLSHSVFKELADKILCSSLHDKDWMDIAASLGCEDVDTLKRIQYWAKQKDELPFYRFLTEEYSKQNGSLGHLTSTFIKLKRYDLLLILKPFIKVLLDENTSSSEIMNENTNEEINNCLIEKKPNELTSIESGFDESFNSQSFSNSNSQSNHEDPTVASNSSLLTKSKTDSIKIIEHSVDVDRRCLKTQEIQSASRAQNDDDDTNLVTSIEDNERVQMENNADSIKIINGETDKEAIDKNIDSKSTNNLASKNVPSPIGDSLNFRMEPSKSDKVSLFITHTEDDFDKACELAIKLRDYGFEVYIQGEQDVELTIDACYIIKEIVKKIDFIVPLVSNQYLDEISPSLEPNDFSNDRLNVRYIFQSLQNNYINKSCLNTKIRPLRLDDVPLSRIRDILELRCSWNISKQLERFRNVLSTTKQLTVL